MTALCGGAASQSKPGFAPTVIMTGGALAGLLNNVPTVWAVTFGALLAGVSYDLTTMCATDPPTLPVMTAGDMVAIALPLSDPAATVVAVAKFYDFVKYWAWWQFCECATVVTPPPAAPPAAPANLPQINPPVGALAVLGNCLDVTVRADVRNWQTTNVGEHYYEFSGLLLNTPRVAITQPFVNAAPTAAQLPGNVAPLSATLTMTGYTDTAAAHDVVLAAYFFNAAGSTVLTMCCAHTSDGLPPRTLTANVPATAASVQVYLEQVAAVTGSNPVTVELAFKCTAAPQVAQPCCPPDPIAAGLLAQILNTVTLIQRQAVPFAYVSGAVHAGLTGAGNLEVNGLLGARVDITAGLAALEKHGTTPVEVFHGGFLTWGTDDGYPHSYRLEHPTMLMLPARCSVFTDLSYDLPAGVTITITELVREP